MLEAALNPLAERTTTPHLQKRADPAAATTKMTAKIVDKTAMMIMTAVIGATIGGEIDRLHLRDGITGTTGIVIGTGTGTGTGMTPGTDPSLIETSEGQSRRKCDYGATSFG